MSRQVLSAVDFLPRPDTSFLPLFILFVNENELYFQIFFYLVLISVSENSGEFIVFMSFYKLLHIVKIKPPWNRAGGVIRDMRFCSGTDGSIRRRNGKTAIHMNERQHVSRA